MVIFVLDRQLVCVVDLPRQGENTARWSVYDLDNKKLSWGYSNGMSGEGAGCVPMAMSNAKAAARRILRKKGT